MNNNPICSANLNGDMSRKQLWLAAFVSAMARIPAAEAETEANAALEIADNRWKQAPTTTTIAFKHSYPVGHQFRQD